MADTKWCVLDETKVCDDCGECRACDLDPTKVCDNCMRCVQKSGADYAAVQIDGIVDEDGEIFVPDPADEEALLGGDDGESRK